jgi:AcrR family transcriptional regulator
VRASRRSSTPPPICSASATWNDLTTADIAKRARIPIGSVCHSFASKEGVLAELVARDTPDPRERALVIREMKRAVIAYLAPELEGRS